jgi:hypothetical protein
MKLAEVAGRFPANGFLDSVTNVTSGQPELNSQASFTCDAAVYIIRREIAGLLLLLQVCCG